MVQLDLKQIHVMPIKVLKDVLVDLVHAPLDVSGTGRNNVNKWITETL